MVFVLWLQAYLKTNWLDENFWREFCYQFFMIIVYIIPFKIILCMRRMKSRYIALF